MRLTQPTMEEVITKIKMVLERKSTREEVADWAWKYVTDDSLVLEDKKLRDLLDCAAGVDIPVSPGKYLFHEEDIKYWIRQFEKK
jgi:hypothetical protein